MIIILAPSSVQSFQRKEFYTRTLVSTVDQRLRWAFSLITVKPVLSGHSKIDKTKILMTNGSSMKDESIAECSHWSILQYFLTCIKP